MEIQEVKRLELLLEFLKNHNFETSRLLDMEDTKEYGFSARIKVWFKPKTPKK
jgi:hypothetical protein